MLGLRGCEQAFCSCGKRLLWSFKARASHCVGFSYREAQARGGQMSVAVVWGLSCCGLTSLVALWRVESSWTRDWTCIPCIGKRVLNCWTPREVPKLLWWGCLCCCWLVTPLHPSGLSSIIFLTTGGLYSLPRRFTFLARKTLFYLDSFPIEIITYRVLSRIPCAIP